MGRGEREMSKLPHGISKGVDGHRPGNPDFSKISTNPTLILPAQHLLLM
jgi:hypothetical protein